MAWALLAGLPLLFMPDTPDPYASIRWFAMSAIATIAWVATFRQWRQVIAATPTAILISLLLFCLAGLCSLLVALHPVEALWNVARWGMLLGLMMQLSWSMRQNAGLRRDVWRAGAVGAILLGGIRLLQYAHVIEGLPAGGDPCAATLGNENFFAGAIVVMAAFGVGAALQERGLWRGLGIGAAVLALSLGALGRSSGALLAMAAMGAYWLEAAAVLKWPQSAYAQRPALRMALPALAMVVGVAAFAWVLSLPVPIAPPQGDSAQERLLIWNKSLEMIAQAPVLGAGAGHWHYEILRLGTVSSHQGFATRYFMQAHNDYLQLTAERGIVGGLAFLSLLGLVWIVGWRRVANGRRDFAAMAAGGGLSAWLVFAATNLPAEQPYLVLLMVVFAAILLGADPEKSPHSGKDKPGSQDSEVRTEPRGRLHLGKWALGIAATMALCATVSLLIHGLWIGADRSNFKVMQAKGGQDWPRTERLAAKAVAWYNPHDRFSGTPLVWYQGVALLSMGNAKAALPKLQAAKAQHPWHPQVSSNLGAAYFMVGDHAAAATELADLIRRFPDFGDARVNLTEIYLTMGKTAEAAETIAYWKSHPGNPQYDDYYAKVSGILAGNAGGNK